MAKTHIKSEFSVMKRSGRDPGIGSPLKPKVLYLVAGEESKEWTYVPVTCIALAMVRTKARFSSSDSLETRVLDSFTTRES